MEIDNQAPSLIKHYEFTTLQIAREQTLLNNRAHWLLLFQGFLFAALSVALSAERMPWYRGIFTWVIPMVGLLSSLITYKGICAAYDAIDDIKGRWEKRSKGHEHLFPPPYSSDKPTRWGRITSKGIAAICCGAWLFILTIFNFQ